MLRRLAALLLVAAAACGGAADPADDLKPLWPRYAEAGTPAAAETSAAAAVPAPTTAAAPVDTGPPPVVLVLPSLGCGACYRKTTKILAAHPEGLRRHAIDVPARKVLLYPIDPSYRPDAIVAALEAAGYVPQIEGETVPES